MYEKSFCDSLCSSPCGLRKHVAAVRPILTTSRGVGFDDGAECPVVNAFECDHLFERQHLLIRGKVGTYDHGSDYNV